MDIFIEVVALVLGILGILMSVLTISKKTKIDVKTKLRDTEVMFSIGDIKNIKKEEVDAITGALGESNGRDEDK